MYNAHVWAINLVSLPILISEIKTKEDVILPQNTDFWSILKLLELIKVHTFFFVLRGYKIFSYIKKMKYIYDSILTPIDTQYKHCSFLSYLRLPRYDVATVRLSAIHQKFIASTRLVAFAAFKREKKKKIWNWNWQDIKAFVAASNLLEKLTSFSHLLHGSNDYVVVNIASRH